MERNRKVDHPHVWLTAVWWVSGASLSAVGCDKKRLLVLQQPVVRRVSCRAAHGCSAATNGHCWKVVRLVGQHGAHAP